MTDKEKLIAEIDEMIVKALKVDEPKPAEVVKPEAIVKGGENDAAHDQIKTGGEGTGDDKLNANGGEDVIKNKDKKDKGLDKLKKDDDKDGDDDEDEDEDDKKKDDKGKMKKSETEPDKVEVTKEQFDRLQKAIKEDADKAEAEKAANDPLVKSVEGLSKLVGKLSNDIEVLKKTPARDQKSITGYQAIAKGGETPAADAKLKKSQVLDAMHALHEAGKIQDIAICEYEATGSIADAGVKSLVSQALNQKV